VPFKDELFHTLGGSDFLDKLDLFDMVGGAFTVNFPEEAAKRVDVIFQQLYDEYTTYQFGRSEMIISLLKIVLIDSRRRIQRVESDLPVSAGQNLVRQYLALLKGAVHAEQHLESFAAQLGVTSGYLTETVKEITGVPAGALLRQRLVLEIKRLLAHTDLTSAQVAEKLGFKDAAYFNRFFKRETGQTPRLFRNGFHRLG
jgi:AraC-like DNA-binding protein